MCDYQTKIKILSMQKKVNIVVLFLYESSWLIEKKKKNKYATFKTFGAMFYDNKVILNVFFMGISI